MRRSYSPFHRVGLTVALVGWALVVGHICIDDAAAETEVRLTHMLAAQVPQAEHSDLHAECVWAASWSMNRSPLNAHPAPEASTRLDRGAILASAVPKSLRSLALDKVPHAGLAPPLYLLHASLLI